MDFEIQNFRFYINGQIFQYRNMKYGPSVSYVNYVSTHVSTHRVDLETMYGLSRRQLSM